MIETTCREQQSAARTPEAAAHDRPRCRGAGQSRRESSNRRTCFEGRRQREGTSVPSRIYFDVTSRSRDGKARDSQSSRYHDTPVEPASLQEIPLCVEIRLAWAAHPAMNENHGGSLSLLDEADRHAGRVRRTVLTESVDCSAPATSNVTANRKPMPGFGAHSVIAPTDSVARAEPAAPLPSSPPCVSRASTRGRPDRESTRSGRPRTDRRAG